MVNSINTESENKIMKNIKSINTVLELLSVNENDPYKQQANYTLNFSSIVNSVVILNKDEKFTKNEIETMKSAISGITWHNDCMDKFFLFLVNTIEKQDKSKNEMLFINVMLAGSWVNMYQFLMPSTNDVNTTWNVAEINDICSYVDNTNEFYDDILFAYGIE